MPTRPDTPPAPQALDAPDGERCVQSNRRPRKNADKRSAGTSACENRDRNAVIQQQGNLIYDVDWHLFLIDHSRAFIKKQDLKGIAPLGRVDRPLWEKMAALSLTDLEVGLGRWVSTDDMKALLIRRDRMPTVIKDMVAKPGENGVFCD